MKISTTPYYDDYTPVFEVTIPDAGVDRPYYEDDSLWKTNKLVDSETHKFKSTRLILNREAEKFEKLSIYMGKELNNEIILEQLANVYEANYNMFFKVWPYSTEKFKSVKDFIDFWIYPAGDMVMDRPGHSMQPHYDNRGIYGNIIVNLTDNECSTVFLNPHNKDVYFYAPIEKNKGLFFLNTDNTFHNIEHKGKTNRFVHSTALTLKQIFE